MATGARQFLDVSQFHGVIDTLHTHWSLDLCRNVARVCGVRFDPKRLRTERAAWASLTVPEQSSAPSLPKRRTNG